MNHEQLVNLALYLAMDLKLNDKQLWACLQDACLKALHLFNTKQICQLEWATTQLKPKQTQARFNTLLMQHVLEILPKATHEELLFIIQGFRNKQSKNLYQKVRKTIVDGRKHLLAKSANKHHDLIDLIYMFASSRPKSFGNYRLIAADELDELIAHYEHDLCEAAEQADAEHLTRLAQAMYILKTGEFENIWWRIENRTNELREEKKLDIYHVVNITRAFSHAQNNRMCATNKTFVLLEKLVL